MCVKYKSGGLEYPGGIKIVNRVPFRLVWRIRHLLHRKMTKEKSDCFFKKKNKWGACLFETLEYQHKFKGPKLQGHMTFSQILQSCSQYFGILQKSSTGSIPRNKGNLIISTKNVK